MFYDDLFFIISVLSIPVLILLLIYSPWDNIEFPWEEKSNDQYERLTFERQFEKAKQTYEELKAIMGKEEIDEILGGNSLNSIVETLNYIGNMASLAGCSMSELADAFNALATPSEETTETQEQKEPQVIFESKVEKEENTLDNWYDNFMEEIKLG